MLDLIGFNLMKLRYILRLLITAGCFMLFTMLLLQDVKMYVQTLANQGRIVLSQYTWEDYSVLHGADPAPDNVQVQQMGHERYRVHRKTLELQKDNNDAGNAHDPEKLDHERYRLSRTGGAPQPGSSSAGSTDTEQCDQKARKALMSRACEWLKENNSPFTNVAKFKDNFAYMMMFVDEKRKLLYCEVPKVACTSWKVLFANLSGKVDPKDYYRLHELVHDTTYHPKVGFKYLKDYTPEQRQYRLQHYYKFLVVRNPYSRIISAWENKLHAQTPQSKWYHDMVGKYIIKKYRKNPSNESLSTGRDARFEELVKFVADPNEQIRQRFDAHWWNIHSVCYPCLFNYDYIAKLETIDEDIGPILEKISPNEKLKLPFLNANTKSSSIEDKAKIEKFFHNISETDLTRLNKIYDVDLKTFGYSMTDNNLECQSNYVP